MAQQSLHTPIHYGSTKPAADVQIEKNIHYLCNSGPGYCKRCLANVLMAKGFYGNMQRAKQKHATDFI